MPMPIDHYRSCRGGADLGTRPRYALLSLDLLGHRIIAPATLRLAADWTASPTRSLAGQAHHVLALRRVLPPGGEGLHAAVPVQGPF
jgi:hypothetical protein